MCRPFVLSLAGLVGLALSSYASPLSTHSTPSSNGKQVPLVPIFPATRDPIENSYIIILRDDVPAAAFDAHTNFVQYIHAEAQTSGNALIDGTHGLKHVYNGHIKGYAGTFAESTIDKIRTRPEVEHIEVDQLMHTMNVTTQKSAPWGLARVSHRPKLTFGTFNTYIYDTDGGEGVDVYIIDTGINIHHNEFQGRASWGQTIPANTMDVDGNGHGTHCAGTIASRKYGVAKAAHVVAVKVLGDNGSGSTSDVVGGIVWAVQAAVAKALQATAEFNATGKTKHKGSVANMSLGGGKSLALDRAVNRAVDAGIHFAVAAGNDNKDACNYSPAAAEKAVTVGASTITDARAYFSNFGPCVDVFGPGLNILSTWTGSPTATNTISGTSMASPHVAGLLAYLLSIYPSENFSPDLTSTALPFSLLDTATQIYPAFASFQRFYSFVRGFFPSAIAHCLPKSRDATAPVPKYPTISPADLKDSLIRLATKDVLYDLPPRTVNKLIFNNATI
ncbi:peptidase S8/S53 domain-containing protein [Hysterangium stoloniferum]|nr:peptidase S8/S53 domain-containing protein [Hysterangium stoloniferum]